MNVLSLFDGMSCGRIALDRAGIKVDKYYASELDKYAIKVTHENWPDTEQLGDVTKWREWNVDWSIIDFLIGGSPCQGFSFAGKQLAFDDPRSRLFFVYVDIRNHINDERNRAGKGEVKFMLENVKMKKECLDIISEQLGVKPVFINSALVSAQNRQRYYWANWEFVQPEDKGIILIDILEDDIDHAFFHSEKAIEYMSRCVSDGRNHWDFNHHSDADKDKSTCVTANTHKGVPYNVLVISDKALRRIQRGKYSKPKFNPVKTGAINTKNNSGQLSLDSGTTLVSSGGFKIGCVRRLSPTECERLQTVPDGYTSCVSNTQRYKMLGNGWTVDVIAHIFKELKSKRSE